MQIAYQWSRKQLRYTAYMFHTGVNIYDVKLNKISCDGLHELVACQKVITLLDTFPPNISPPTIN